VGGTAANTPTWPLLRALAPIRQTAGAGWQHYLERGHPNGAQFTNGRSLTSSKVCFGVAGGLNRLRLNCAGTSRHAAALRLLTPTQIHDALTRKNAAMDRQHSGAAPHSPR